MLLTEYGKSNVDIQNKIKPKARYCGLFLCLEKTMAEAITSLTLEINTQSVDEANKKLDAFSKKA